MGQIRKRHSTTFKPEVALEAVKPDMTIAELAKPHQAHPVQISRCKNQLLDGVENVFENGSASRRVDPGKLQTELYKPIGRLQMELAWVKKIWTSTSQRGGVGSSRTTRTSASDASANCRA